CFFGSSCFRGCLCFVTLKTRSVETHADNIAIGDRRWSEKPRAPCGLKGPRSISPERLALLEGIPLSPLFHHHAATASRTAGLSWMKPALEQGGSYENAQCESVVGIPGCGVDCGRQRVRGAG